MKRTPWFDGSVKPWEPGPYERLYDAGTAVESVAMCKFDGVWYANGYGASDAMMARFISGSQNLPWRGLTKEAKK